MTTRNKTETEAYTLSEAVRRSVAVWLDTAEADEFKLLVGLDRWTRNRVIAENMAKMEMILEASDPAEHCYRNLIREIDSEAEMGVLLANSTDAYAELTYICEEAGVSGALHREIEQIAPVLFADEYAHSNADLDLVWASIKGVYDRARFDAETSQLAMSHFMDSASSAADMVRAMRSLFYAFHEEGTRRQFDLPMSLDSRESQDLFVMVAELMKRAGSYEDRITAIENRAAKPGVT